MRWPAAAQLQAARKSVVVRCVGSRGTALSEGRESSQHLFRGKPHEFRQVRTAERQHNTGTVGSSIYLFSIRCCNMLRPTNAITGIQAPMFISLFKIRMISLCCALMSKTQKSSQPSFLPLRSQKSLIPQSSAAAHLSVHFSMPLCPRAWICYPLRFAPQDQPCQHTERR